MTLARLRRASALPRRARTNPARSRTRTTTVSTTIHQLMRCPYPDGRRCKHALRGGPSSGTAVSASPHHPSRTPSGLDEVRVQLDLDDPTRVEQADHDHHRAGWSDVTEDLAVRGRDRIADGEVGDELAGAYDGLRRAAQLGKSSQRDLPAAPG